MAYHAGVLRALEEVGGFRPDDADLIVGTSAGSMMGAMVRSGLTTDDLFRASIGEHPELGHTQARSPWAAAWDGPIDAMRRLIGSMYVLQRSAVRLPVPPLPAALRRAFPAGFFTIDDAEDTISEVLPNAWPDRPLWLVTVDVGTGRRVVLGTKDPVRTDLHTAVKASCAIPAFFLPQRVDGRTLVDGGVHSTSNLDLATGFGADVAIAVVPMAFDTSPRPPIAHQLGRLHAQRRLERELVETKRAGTSVLLLRPTADDLDAFGGLNMMRRQGNERVARVAYDSAARQLASPYARGVLERLQDSVAG
jgi:NTE family protein